MNVVIEDVVEYINELFKGNADGHDAQHSLRVYKTAMSILEVHPEADGKVVALAALLHDVDDHKLFDTVDNANARAFLKRFTEDGELTQKNYSEDDKAEIITHDQIELICEVINSVSFSKNKGVKPRTIEGCIVQDADRLDAMGALGVARTFAYGGKHGRSIEESMEHFHDKLLLLKDEMNTPEGRRLAEERHEFLVDFIEEIEKEM